MARVLIGSCNDSLLFRCAMHDLRESMEAFRASGAAPPGMGEGSLGLAVVMEREMVLQKRPVHAGFDPFPILEDLHTNLFLLVHEPGPAAAFQATRSLPSRYRSWVFAMSGDLPEVLVQADGPFSADLPGFLHSVAAKGERGSSVFAWALGTLYAASLLDARTEMRRRVLEVAVRTMGRLFDRSGLRALPFTFALASRDLVFGFAGEPGVQVLERPGIEHCQLCSDHRDTKRRSPHEHVRTLLLAAAPEPLPRPWRPLAVSQGFVMGPDGSFDSIPVAG